MASDPVLSSDVGKRTSRVVQPVMVISVPAIVFVEMCLWSVFPSMAPSSQPQAKGIVWETSVFTNKSIYCCLLPALAESLDCLFPALPTYPSPTSRRLAQGLSGLLQRGDAAGSRGQLSRPRWAPIGGICLVRGFLFVFFVGDDTRVRRWTSTSSSFIPPPIGSDGGGQENWKGRGAKPETRHRTCASPRRKLAASWLRLPAVRRTPTHSRRLLPSEPLNCPSVLPHSGPSAQNIHSINSPHISTDRSPPGAGTRTPHVPCVLTPRRLSYVRSGPFLRRLPQVRSPLDLRPSALPPQSGRRGSPQNGT